jgi:hypothetical protein
MVTTCWGLLERRMGRTRVTAAGTHFETGASAVPFRVTYTVVPPSD